eukprot:CAMPEP_0202842194 /NCGR_PEP_ID=MMETSP1389-20130828/60777_1 /ASSEMBLY_ACC=CAM_ASM_000865 /TAXON_ID=302021 /ORGANISM="Rhodomonas sp., Strain CCMP768" /LENGTH=51 /DNA_ID=CAMNT_0049519121 /DNA_START=205 /DNA_END=357 /DNA_ORIENTATION=+
MRAGHMRRRTCRMLREKPEEDLRGHVEQRPCDLVHRARHVARGSPKSPTTA